MPRKTVTRNKYIKRKSRNNKRYRNKNYTHKKQCGGSGSGNGLVPMNTDKNGSVPNGPVSNGLVSNGPVSNGPGLVLMNTDKNGSVPNGPVSNGLVSNSPVSNGPVSNGPVSNGPGLVPMNTDKNGLTIKPGKDADALEYYRPFEEFLNNQSWENPKSGTIAHVVKVFEDIAHDFNDDISDNYGDTCSKLILNYQNGENKKYFELFEEWVGSSKTIRERFLLLHILSILDPTLLETGLSIFHVKIENDNRQIVNKLKGPGLDKIFLQNLYFTTDAFGSSSVFDGLITEIENKTITIPDRHKITSVNKNYSNIFDPASLAAQPDFYEDVSKNYSNIFEFDQKVLVAKCKTLLEESTQLYFDFVVTFFTKKTPSYKIKIVKIKHPAIHLTIDDTHYVHIHGDNSISAVKSGSIIDDNSLPNYKQDVLTEFKNANQGIKRLYDFFNNSEYSSTNLKYSYKSFGDWVQSIYTKKLDTFIQKGVRQGQNGISMLGIKTLDKYVFTDVILSALPLFASSIYLKHLVVTTDSDDTPEDEASNENAKECILTLFSSQCHKSSLKTFSVFKSILSNFGFTVPDNLSNDQDDGFKLDMEKLQWLDNISFKNGATWKTIKGTTSDDDFLKEIVAICEVYHQYNGQFLKNVIMLADKINTVMVNVSTEVEAIQKQLKDWGATKKEIERLNKLINKLKEPHQNSKTLEKLLVDPCIKKLEYYNISTPQLPQGIKNTSTTTDQLVGRFVDVATVVDGPSIKSNRRTSSRRNLQKTSDPLIMQALASRAVKTNMSLVTEIYAALDLINRDQYGGASANAPSDYDITVELFEPLDNSRVGPVREWLLLNELILAYNECIIIQYNIRMFLHNVSWMILYDVMKVDSPAQKNFRGKLRPGRTSKKRDSKNQLHKRIQNITTKKQSGNRRQKILELRRKSAAKKLLFDSMEKQETEANMEE